MAIYHKQDECNALRLELEAEKKQHGKTQQMLSQTLIKVKQSIKKIHAKELEKDGMIQRLQHRVESYKHEIDDTKDDKPKKIKIKKKKIKCNPKIKIKIILGEDVRIWRDYDIKTKSKLASLKQFVSESFDLKNDILLQYEDEERDRITLSVENDLDDALNYTVEQEMKSLKIFVIENELEQQDILLAEAEEENKYYQEIIDRLSQNVEDDDDNMLHPMDDMVEGNELDEMDELNEMNELDEMDELNDIDDNMDDKQELNILHPVPFEDDELMNMEWMNVKTKNKKDDVCKDMNIKRNDRNHRNGKKRFICNFCGKKCSSNWNVQSHIKNMHEPKKYKCKVCRKRFGTKYLLLRHNIIHSGAKPYNCNKCKKRFGRKDHLTQHQRHAHK